MVNEYTVDERFRRYVGHGSLGMTNKYYMNEYWYKQNLKGYEGKSEYICSIMLEHSNTDNFVRYEECLINGVPGCRSKNFLRENETLVTFSRLYSLMYGGDLKLKVNTYGRMADRINYVLDFVYEATGLDAYGYLGRVLKFDMLTYDVDRHFNNLAVIASGNGYREAPMFDFGASFFSMQHIFTSDMSLEEKIQKMTPQPFSSGFEEQAEFFWDVQFQFDYDGIMKEISLQPPELQEIICHNLEKYKDTFQEHANYKDRQGLYEEYER